MSTLSYKGYTARIDFDARDHIFVGRILGLRSIVSFHASSVRELTKEFHTAIEDYLSDCQASGIFPEKPASGRLMLRIPSEVHGIALVAAQASGLSLNQWAIHAIQTHAEQTLHAHV
jgi:predicted HicB family RNase H-like nuclease